MSLRRLPLDRLPAVGSCDEGLSAAQVEAQRAYGFNDIVAHAASGRLVVWRDTARDPTLWFLVLGPVTELVTLLVAMPPLPGMDAYLHRRTSASSAGLASLLARTARVLREGQWHAIPSRELIPGDLVEVTPGESRLDR